LIIFIKINKRFFLLQITHANLPSQFLTDLIAFLSSVLILIKKVSKIL
jgi:hypothetical protein